MENREQYNTNNDADYYRIERLSNSGMSSLALSPLHYRYAMDNPKDTDAMRFGRHLHSLVLEPEKIVLKHKKSDVIEDSDTVVTVDTYFKLMAMRDVVMPVIESIVSKNALFEQPVFWQDEDSSALCKAKADIIDGDFIWDLKTTSSVCGDFPYAVKKYAYDRQAAFYRDAFNASGFGFIVIEKMPPHGVKLFVASKETLEKGRDKYKPLCSLYAQCCFLEQWQGYGLDRVSV